MKLLPVHHGGMIRRPIGPGAEPLQALFHRHPLWNQEGPVHRVQFWVSIHAAVIPNVSPKKRADVGIDIPFPFLLQELEPRGSILLDGGSPGAAMAGRDTAVRLHFGRVRAVVRGEVKPCFHSAIPVLEGETVGGDSRDESHQRSQGGTPMEVAGWLTR